MTQSPQEQIDSLVNKLAATLCRIKKSPKGRLPLIVFVEEQDSNGYLIYHKYMLKKICRTVLATCIIPTRISLEHNDYYLTAINTDSLITVWNRYVELRSNRACGKTKPSKIDGTIPEPTSREGHSFRRHTMANATSGPKITLRYSED